MIKKLPIYEIIPKLKSTLSKLNNVVLQAPPGAGKTTVIPLELLGENWLGDKKIIMLEPRRLAARASARRMAETLGEKVGETVGYRVKMDRQVGPKTRIEIVTEGVLIRKLQSDPELIGVGLLIFDEFHERSIDADLGLALGLDVQEGFRADLKILVMSATLDGGRIASLMNNAPIITSEGRVFPVEYRYLDKKITRSIEDEMAAAIIRSLQAEPGSILAFLPGAREIEKTKKEVENSKFLKNVVVCPLYGSMSFEEQDLAIKPPPQGWRKVVLATDIAQTSLTIEGIRIVIDSGQQRSAIFDIKSGMTGLETRMLSKASALQRAGRAGRLEEGICFRLWSQAANRALKPFDLPEIMKVDLTPLALNLALWGITDASALKWLDLPDPVSMGRARDLLQSLGALNDQMRITDHGRAMAQFPMSPRLSHMILTAKKNGYGFLALTIAALLQERDLLRQSVNMRTVDFRLRIEALIHMKSGRLKQAKMLGVNIRLAKSILRQISVWQRSHKITDDKIDISKAGLCLAVAFPDRIGGRRVIASPVYLLSGGRGASLLADDPLAREEFIAVAHLDKGVRDARIYIAAPIEKNDLEDAFQDRMTEENVVEWNTQAQAVRSVNTKMLGKMIFETKKILTPDPNKTLEALIEGIRKMGLGVLPWEKNSVAIRKRVELIRGNLGYEFPDFTDDGLLKNIEMWLAGYLTNINNRQALKGLDLYAILKSQLNWKQQQLLERLAPTHIIVPSGSNVKLDYETDPPVLAVKLQEMFGAVETPTILDGYKGLIFHLLSPAGRPLQITSDLARFWKNSYPEIQKEMKGRYPKHPWPDNPLEAMPTQKLKSRK